MVVHLVHKLGLVEESDEDDTDTTTKAPAGGSVEFPAEMDTTAARVVTYPDVYKRQRSGRSRCTGNRHRRRSSRSSSPARRCV